MTKIVNIKFTNDDGNIEKSYVRRAGAVLLWGTWLEIAGVVGSIARVDIPTENMAAWLDQQWLTLDTKVKRQNDTLKGLK